MEQDAYKTMIGGVIADPYRIARAYDLDPVIAQAVKKLLRCGRKHKSRHTDVAEAISTLERWQSMEKEDSTYSESDRAFFDSLVQNAPCH